MRKPSSTNSQNRRILVRCCILNDVLERLALRWKMPVLRELANGATTYRELRRALPAASDQMLAKRLRELVDEGLALKLQTGAEAADGGRRTCGGAGQRGTPRYRVTAAGDEVLAIMEDICAWGSRHAHVAALRCGDAPA